MIFEIALSNTGKLPFPYAEYTIGCSALPDRSMDKRPTYCCPRLKKTVSPALSNEVPLLTCAMLFQGEANLPLAVLLTEEGSQ
jgi:hypothetical protein